MLRCQVGKYSFASAAESVSYWRDYLTGSTMLQFCENLQVLAYDPVSFRIKPNIASIPVNVVHRTTAGIKDPVAVVK
jgi:hypothetical protein